MQIPYPGMLRGQRSYEAISKEQTKKIIAWWIELGGDPQKLVIDRHSRSRCFLDEQEGVVHLGSDLNPGNGCDPNSTMRWRAVVVHEFRHLQRFEMGMQLSPGPLDEAITDLEACAYPQVTQAIRDELVADALQRLYAFVQE